MLLSLSLFLPCSLPSIVHSSINPPILSSLLPSNSLPPPSFYPCLPPSLASFLLHCTVSWSCMKLHRSCLEAFCPTQSSNIKCTDNTFYNTHLNRLWPLRLAVVIVDAGPIFANQLFSCTKADHILNRHTKSTKKQETNTSTELNDTSTELPLPVELSRHLSTLA